VNTVFALLAFYILFLGVAEFFRKVRALWRWLFRRAES
jgi:hypothetical protein